ncbi:MAG: VOC family protein [Planctomycetota bacterium]
MSEVSPVPEGMHTVTPYLVVKDSVAAMDFYAKAFGAVQLMRMVGPDGQGTMHAEIKIGNSCIMLTDENPAWGMSAPETIGGSPVSLMLYVEDADTFLQTAVAAGCEAVFPVSEMFWGDKMGKVSDPFGYSWSIATHIEDVPEEEMAVRQQKWMEEMAAAAQGGEQG